MFGYTMKITYSNLVIFILFYFLTLVIENLKNHFFFSEFWISLFNHELSKEIKMFTALSNQALTKCKSFASFEWNSDSSQSDVCFLNFHGNVFSEFLTFHNIDWLHIFNVVATLKCKVHVHATRNKSSTLVKHQSITCPKYPNITYVSWGSWFEDNSGWWMISQCKNVKNLWRFEFKKDSGWTLMSRKVASTKATY